VVRAVMSVPGAAGLSVLRMPTGMPRSTAGLMVAGWSTLAPKYASSAASSKLTSCRTLAPGTTLGSTVIMPSTSVQIWMASTGSVAPMTAAE
jgi:hypothetical protein